MVQWRSNTSQNRCTFQGASIFLYNSETWTIMKTTAITIGSFQRRLLRNELNICWSAKIGNIDLYRESKKVEWRQTKTTSTGSWHAIPRKHQHGPHMSSPVQIRIQPATQNGNRSTKNYLKEKHYSGPRKLGLTYAPAQDVPKMGLPHISRKTDGWPL